MITIGLSKVTQVMSQVMMSTSLTSVGWITSTKGRAPLWDDMKTGSH